VACHHACDDPAAVALVAGPFRALADPVRLRLLLALGDGERSVSTLARDTGLALATTSQHLQRLAAAGLVARRRAGTRVLYRLADPAVLALVTRCATAMK
jgi:DNA-binding transcriptional ArsR family regulator